jgi:CubicO group peptidase (beta-lactamase class C family)
MRARGLRWTAALVAVVVCCGAAAAGAASAASGPPVDVSGRWPVAPPAAEGMDGALLARGDAFVRKQLPYVTSMLVVRHGRIVLERYYGSSATTLGDVQSVTKSVISVLVGIALARRDLTSLDQKLVDFVPAGDITSGTDPRVQRITLRDLLTMSGGFEGDGTTGNFDYTNTSDWVRALVNRKLVADPGTAFSYDSGTAHLLSAVLSNATGMSAEAYARRYLFGPLRLGKVVWPKDPTGVSLGGWGLELTARQMAKLGYLYLHRGRWNARQVVPAAWVAASTGKQVSTRDTGRGSWGLPPASWYGYLWWTYPRQKPAGFFAVGRGGQFILVWPKLDLIVVTTAVVQDGDWNLGGLLERYVLPAVRS